MTAATRPNTSGSGVTKDYLPPVSVALQPLSLDERNRHAKELARTSLIAVVPSHWSQWQSYLLVLPAQWADYNKPPTLKHQIKIKFQSL